MAGDSSYIGTDILLDSLVFTSESGIDTLVDDFGDYMSGTTSVIETLPGIPSGFSLSQNYPNPFNPNTKIRYEISEYSSVKLTIYSLLGEEIATLVNAEQPAGIYEADFDGTGLSSGTYICVLRTREYVLQKKMILMK
jgi:hypothetical protein